MKCVQCSFETPAIQPYCPRCGSAQSTFAVQAEEVASPLWRPAAAASRSSSPATPDQKQALAPETPLHGGRYLLVEQRERRQWDPQVYETEWLVHDMEGKGRVIVSEVALPLSGSERLAFFTTASRALLRSSSLLNVFLEQNRGFFVFAPPVGESLPVRIQRRGLLSEQEAVNCYAQIAATLLSFSQQQPTVVHGLIQSDHIFRVGSNWALTHGSLLAAGGATRLLPSLEETPGATQSTPDSDLFALSAVIYSAVTGSVPPLHREEQQRKLTHASLSATFAAVLLKGVHPQSDARYHHPSEVLRALGRESDRTPEEEQRLRRRDTILQRVQQATHPSGSLPQGPRRS